MYHYRYPLSEMGVNPLPWHMYKLLFYTSIYNCLLKWITHILYKIDRNVCKTKFNIFNNCLLRPSLLKIKFAYNCNQNIHFPMNIPLANHHTRRRRKITAVVDSNLMQSRQQRSIERSIVANEFLRYTKFGPAELHSPVGQKFSRPYVIFFYQNQCFKIKIPKMKSSGSGSLFLSLGVYKSYDIWSIIQ